MKMAAFCLYVSGNSKDWSGSFLRPSLTENDISKGMKKHGRSFEFAYEDVFVLISVYFLFIFTKKTFKYFFL